jgi:hypothetical protein
MMGSADTITARVCRRLQNGSSPARRGAAGRRLQNFAMPLAGAGLFEFASTRARRECGARGLGMFKISRRMARGG